MIAKRIERTAGADYGRLAKYVVNAQGRADPTTWTRTADYILDTAGGGEKVGGVRVTNCMSDDPAAATLEILATQDQNTRSKKEKDYHLVISFPPGERPELATLHKIEDALVAAIGMADHQRISAVHVDTEHLHVHVAINKVHPRTFRNVEPYFDKARLMESCERLEQQFGLERTNHGAAAARKVHGRAADMEAHAGLASFQRWVKEQAADDLRAAAEAGGSWQDLHRTAAAFGLEIRPRGAGLVIGLAGEKLAVKASSIGRGFSMKSLTERFGPYHPPERNDHEHDGNHDGYRPDERTAAVLRKSYRQAIAEEAEADSLNDLRTLSSLGVVRIGDGGEVLLPGDAAGDVEQGGTERADPLRRQDHGRGGGRGVGGDRYHRRPLHTHPSTETLYAAYQRSRELAIQARAEARQQVRQAHTTYSRELREWYEQRRLITRTRRDIRGAAKRAEYARLKAERDADLVQRRALEREQQAQVRRQHPLPTWQGFLQQVAAAGDEQALAVLRSRAGRQQRFHDRLVTATDPTAAASVVFRHLQPRLQKNGDVRYRIEDGGTVVDSKGALHVEQASEGAMVLALSLAKERFAGQALQLDGDEAFQAAAVKAAVLHNLDIRFQEPALEQQRQAAVAARTMKADHAAGALQVFVNERNALRSRVSDISYHRAWTPDDAGAAEYQGRRRLKDGTEAVLLKRAGTDTMLVKPVTSAQAAKASRWRLGRKVHVDDRGRFIDRNRDRGAAQGD